MKPNFFSSFLNKYSLNKTLRFELIPLSPTDTYIKQEGFIQEDEKKSQEYKHMKETIDAMHRDFIDKAMLLLKEQTLEYGDCVLLNEREINEKFTFNDLELYLKSYNEFKKDRKKNKTQYNKQCEKLRKKFINNTFNSSAMKTIYSDLFKKELFTEHLPKFIEDNQEQDLFYSDTFKRFTVYFTGFHENRKNMYTAEEKSTAIAFRLINENLPRFIDNLENFSQIKPFFETLGLSQAERSFLEDCGLKKLSDINAFIDCISQDGIDTYNALIGGKTTENGQLHGINSALNQYNQNKDKNKRIPLLKPLYKQILSDRVALSFLPPVFSDINEMYQAISHYYYNNLLASKNPNAPKSGFLFQDLQSLFEMLAQGEFNFEQIYISKLNINTISTTLFGQYHFIIDALECYYKNDELYEYEKKFNKAKTLKQKEKLETDLDVFLKQPYFSVSLLEVAIEAYIKTFDEDMKQVLINKQNQVREYFINNYHTQIKEKQYSFENAIIAQYSCIKGELEKDHEISYRPNEITINNIKIFLDTILQLTHFVKQLIIKRSDILNLEVDKKFYTLLEPLFAELEMSVKLYDKVRNYLTKKPYSTEKIKLTFNEPTLANGWDENKEKDNKCALFQKDEKMYLGIINNKALAKSSYKMENLFDVEQNNKMDCYKKMVYKFFPDVTKMIPKCSLTKAVKSHFISGNTNDFILNDVKFKQDFAVPYKIFEMCNVGEGEIKKFQRDYLKNTQDKKGYSEAVQNWISFCHNFLKSYKSTASYDYNLLKPLHEYKDVPSFYTDLNNLCYKVHFKDIPSSHIDELVKQGILFLFEIHNKDYNKGTYGKANLHTLYWKALFSEENLNNTHIKLNGEAEVFWRKSSISQENTFVHQKGKILINKTTNKGEAIPDEIYINIKKVILGEMPKTDLNSEELYFYENSVHKEADYDLTKDKRFTKDKFLFHVPIMFNFQSLNDSRINNEVMDYIKDNPAVNIIGIDRGERHLLYLTVINQQGEILEQESLNILDGVNYHSKLDAREKERDESRKKWQSIYKISELKEGYLSHVVHKICQMMIKYNAIIVLEDLNFGFKRGRFKVEKQVYQKFEKALIQKLNYLSFKDIEQGNEGGVLKGYQLTEEFVSFKKMGKQNGFIFYLTASNTSKIDPISGFVDRLKPSYKNKEQAQAFFAKFDSIIFNESENSFEFTYKESNFISTGTQKWTIKSFDEWRYTWNSTANQNKGNMEKIHITNEFIKLFSSIGVDYNKEDLRLVLSQTDNITALKKAIYLLRILLMMRYSYKDRDFIRNHPISPILQNKKISDILCSSTYLRFCN